MLELDWPNKTKTNTFLEVELKFCNRSLSEIDKKHISRAPWEHEVGLQKYSMTHQEMAKAGGLFSNEHEDLDTIKKQRSWEKY